MNSFVTVLYWVLFYYRFVVILYIIMSWFPNFQSTPFYKIAARLTEPLLERVRSIIPPIGGIDLSALLVIILIQVALFSLI